MDAASKGKAGSLPLDWGPILVVSLSMLVITYTLANVFPYVGFMAAGFEGYSIDNAGFVAGYIASSFTFGRLISSYFWGWAADRFGRKPVLIWSMANMALWSIGFGISDSLAWAIFTRFCMGVTNGAMSTGRAMIPELAGKEHTVAAMSYAEGAKGVAYALGPAIGGLLAQPVIHYPSIFSSTSVFARYPYLLPNLIGALLSIITVPLVIFVVPEGSHDDGARCDSNGPINGTKSPQHFEAVEDEPTGTCQPDISGDKISIIEDVEQSSINPSGPVGGVVQYVHLPDNLLTEEYVKIVVKTDSSTSSSIGHNTRVGDHKVALLSGATGDASNVYGSIADASGVEGGDIAKAGVSQYLHGGVFGENGLLSISHVPMLLVIAAIHSALCIGFEEAYPLWALSSYGVGGLEWNSFDIGKALGITGVGMTIYQIFFYSWLTKRIGIAKMQIGASYAAMATLLIISNVNILSWDNSSLLIISAAILTIMWSCLSTISVGMNLASTSPVPSHVRGKLSGLFLMSQSFGRTFGPVTWATVYAWSVSSSPTGGARIPLVDYRFIFNVSALLMAVVAVLSRRTLTVETMTNVVDERPGVIRHSCSRQ